MRQLVLGAVIALLFGAVVVAPVDSQQSPSAGGSCGYTADQSGLNALATPPWSSTVGRVYWQAKYTGVVPGTSVKVLTFYNNQLEELRGATVAPADGSSGAVASSFVVGGE